SPDRDGPAPAFCQHCSCARSGRGHLPGHGSNMISVCFLLLPGTLIMDVAGPAEVFRLANQHLEATGKPAQFALQFISPEHTITSSVGLSFHDIAPLPDLRQLRKSGPV